MDFNELVRELQNIGIIDESPKQKAETKYEAQLLGENPDGLPEIYIDKLRFPEVDTVQYMDAWRKKYHQKLNNANTFWEMFFNELKVLLKYNNK